MPNIMDFAKNMIRSNLKTSNAPWAQAGIDAIMNGDSAKGEEIADNLCKSFGMSREQMLAEARKRMNIPF